MGKGWLPSLLQKSPRDVALVSPLRRYRGELGLRENLALQGGLNHSHGAGRMGRRSCREKRLLASLGAAISAEPLGVGTPGFKLRRVQLGLMEHRHDILWGQG